MEAVEQQEQEIREYVVVSCISLWERNKMRWIAMYERLGRAPSTMSKDLEEKRTGKWQNNIRNAKKNGTLSEARIADLEAILGWEWHWRIEETWEEQKQNWVAHYTKLQKAPSETSKDQEERRAANWHGKQRKAYHKNKISDERRATLEALLGWEWGTKKEKIYTWEDQKQNWVAHYTKLQKAPSPTSKEKDAKRAGVWQCGLRETYHKKTLSKERTAELEAIPGWEWRSYRNTERGVRDTWEQHKQNWVTQYTKLQRYPSPLSKDSEEKRAGAWQGKQRTAYNKGTLSEETITELEDISGWAWNSGWAWDSDTWEQKKLNWITLYNTLQRTPLPSSKENDEKKAGQWQQTQRQTKKNGKMPSERIMALEEIPGWTWSGR
jgi:hypothetical protein